MLLVTKCFPRFPVTLTTNTRPISFTFPLKLNTCFVYNISHHQAVCYTQCMKNTYTLNNLIRILCGLKSSQIYKYPSMNRCTDEKLDEFSNEHFTYINQIFGDETIREIIKETYVDRDWTFAVEDANADFEYSNHHVLIKKGKDGKNIKWCSVDEKYQNILVNKNDTLCQSYTLMKYLNKPIPRGMKERQMDMIKMYRNILRKQHFQTELQQVLSVMQRALLQKQPDKDVVLWKDYTKNRSPALNVGYADIYYQIHNTLDNWEKFGYHHFIKDGVCPVKPLKN